MVLEGKTAADLIVSPPAPPQWVIPDFLSEGALVLSGQPKIGKSFLALQIVTNIVAGEKVFGRFPTIPGRVHYLGLEDNESRFYQRILKQGFPQKNWEKLHFYTRASQGKQCLEDCRQLLIDYPDTKVIVIDTMERIRGARAANSNAYADDYDFMGTYQQLALEYHVVILFVHHTRKPGKQNENINVQDAILGTRGIAGGAETLWVLVRSTDPEHYAEFHTEGKGIGTNEYYMEFDEETCTWSLTENNMEQTLSPQREIIKKVASDYGFLSVQEYYEKILNGDKDDKTKQATIRQQIHRMTRSKQLAKDSFNRYGPLPPAKL